jgi:hypothetical protein
VATETATAGERIDRLASGVYSFTWQVDPDVLRSAAATTRPWAEHHIGSLSEPRPVRRTIAWRAYDR